MSKPRILLLDIETTPHKGYFWNPFKPVIAPCQIDEPSEILCWAAKWLGEKKIEYRDWSDEDCITKIYEMIDEADAIVHYNGKQFDMKHLNREFLLAKMGPPSPYINVDLLSTIRTNFKFASNKLEWTSIQMGYDGKIQNRGMQLWFDCMKGDPKAFKEMKTYNIQDVRLLEDMHDELLPWIKNYPNFGLYVNDDDPTCTHCGSKDIKLTHKPSYTAVRIYNRYHCQGCGKWQRGRTQKTTTGMGVLK